jgi:ABC-2 type transport system ATP-binding protein
MKGDAILRVENLTKTYKNLAAVDNINFKIKKGEILGLLGPNGAGKTTTIQMLLGLTTPTSGSIHYFGKDFSKHEEYCLSRINFTSAYSRVQGKLTVKQNLRIYSGLYGTINPNQKIEEMTKLFGVNHLLDEVYWHLSSGQQTRVNLVKMMLNSPKLILMDEPTASLDPEIVNKVLNLILKLQKKEGMSILFTSHNMAEVEKICDRVIFLDKGKIVAEDTPLGLTKIVGNVKLSITFDGDQKPVSNYLDKKGIKYKYLRKHVVDMKVSEELVPSVLFGFKKADIWVTNISIEKPNLEDVFISIAKGKYNESQSN